MDATSMPPLGRYNFTPHAHECINPGCRFVWAHDPNEIQEETEEIFDAAHHCPQCRTEVTKVYRGARKPRVIHDGANPDQPVLPSKVVYVEDKDETRRPPVNREASQARAALLALLRELGVTGF